MQHKNSSVSVSVRVSCLCHPKAGNETPANRNKNLIKFLQSFIILPVFAVSSSLFGIVNNTIDTPSQIAVLPQINMEANSLVAFNQLADQKSKLKEQADAIDAYFHKRNMPLEGHGMGMVIAAEKYGLDYRLLAAIAVRETTGGSKACPVAYSRTGDIGYKFNVFGWGSCKIKFKSYEDAFEVLAKNLSGNNPNTEHHYSGKTTKEILQKYNPPSIIPNYAAQVMAIMDDIGKEEITPDEAVSSSGLSAQKV